VIGETEFALLNAVYLKKLASLDELSVITSIPLETVEDFAARFSTNEALFSMPAGVMLMPAGTELVLAYYHETYETLRANPLVTQWYERFEVLNTRFISLISEWQRSERDPHALDKVIQVVERLVTAIETIVGDIPRYEGYARRFRAAVDRVDSGDAEYVSNPTKDSIHNVWFEFHEDILAVLGRPRDTT
jgi:hypothetical protein